MVVLIGFFVFFVLKFRILGIVFSYMIHRLNEVVAKISIAGVHSGGFLRFEFVRMILIQTSLAYFASALWLAKRSMSPISEKG